MDLLSVLQGRLYAKISDIKNTVQKPTKKAKAYNSSNLTMQPLMVSKEKNNNFL